MKESARLARNTQRLAEMHAPTGARMRKVLDRMQSQGFRPRIQDAWRSPKDQEEAFLKGNSKVRFGFHNVTAKSGAKESLACDVLDDDHPLAPPTRYLLALVIAARAEKLDTGILWDLPAPLRTGVEAAIASKDVDRKVKVGFDPTHVEPVGISIAKAKAGKRPTFGSASGAATTAASAGGKKFHVVVRGETLSGIAKRFGISLARILQLNPHKLANPNLILVGETIRVA